MAVTVTHWVDWLHLRNGEAVEPTFEGVGMGIVQEMKELYARYGLSSAKL